MRFHRRALLGATAAATAAVLSGCIAETPPSGPVVPTPTAVTRITAPIGGAPGRHTGRRFRVSGAGNDIRESLLTTLWQPFAAVTGCELEVGITDYSVLSSPGAGDHVDLALVSDEWALRLAESGGMAELDAVGADGTVPDIVPPTPISIPAYADAIVNASRVDAVSPDAYPTDWADWWDARALPGARAMMKGPFGTFEFALLADGVAAAELYPLDLERAIASLQRVSGSILDRWWETGPQVIDWLAGGRAALATAYAHQVVTANWAGRPVRMELNQGMLIADHWVVPADAANGDVARDFIAVALSTPAQAALANSAALSPVSTAALPLIDPLLANQLPTAPGNLPGLLRSDVSWWTLNRSLTSQAFNGWLLGDPRGF